MTPFTDRINDGLVLTQRPDGLKFGTDALLLAASVPADPKHTRRLAELGSGTGVVSLLLAARERAARLFAYEIQPTYAALTAENVAQNGLSDKIAVLCRDVRDACPADTAGEVDIVVSNPPYMAENSGLHSAADERDAARRELNGTIRDFCAAASRLLRSGGSFYVVYRPERLVPLLCAMHDCGIEPKSLTVVYDYPGAVPRILLAHGRKGAGEGVTVTRPLYLHPEKNAEALTPEAAAVYRGEPLSL